MNKNDELKGIEVNDSDGCGDKIRPAILFSYKVRVQQMAVRDIWIKAKDKDDAIEKVSEIIVNDSTGNHYIDLLHNIFDNCDDVDYVGFVEVKSAKAEEKYSGIF